MKQEVERIPRVDLHRHLEGSIRPETVLDLVRQYNLPLPKTYEELLPLIRVYKPDPDIMTFITKLDRAISILVDYQACSRIAYEGVEDALAEGIEYLELRFSPLYMAGPHGLAPEGVVEAVINGAKQAEQEYGIRVNLIGILSRTFGVKACQRELMALLAFKEQIVGLDLAGDERRFPAELFIKHFRQGRDAGLRVTVHAGEVAGPESIWTAIRELGAERIGHGIRAIEDIKLMEYLAKHQIGIESCITSNVQTTSVSSYADFPLRTFLEQGIRACINTDDPKVSGIDLSYELTVAAKAAGLDEAMIRKTQENALKMAFGAMLN